MRMRGWVSVTLLGAMSAAGVSGAAKTAPKDVEDALRNRVGQFYQLMVDKKFRAAEDLIDPDSRDAYYVNEKPSIEDFRVEGISWEDNFTTANLTIVSKTKIRNPRVGEYEENVPYSSHWKVENGQWFWFIPKVTVRQTPFGVMKVDPGVAAGSGMDLKAMIAKGPTQKDLLQGVGVDRAEVHLTGNKSQEVKIENKLPGRVSLRAEIVSGAGFDVALRDSGLEGRGKTQLFVSRRKGVEFKPGRLALMVQPTGQVLQIAVN